MNFNQLKKEFFFKKLIIIVSIFFFINLIILSYFLLNPFQYGNNLRVIFFDVNQGDSTLIQTPTGQNILIDGGPGRNILFKLDKYIPLTNRKIDLMILTNPSANRTNGLVEVLRRWKVKKVAYTGIESNRSSYVEWQKIVREKKIPILFIDEFKILKLGDNVFLEFLWPSKNLRGKSFKNNNSISIVSRLVFDNIKFLFTSDAIKDVERKLMDANVNIKANVLKVGHHGSKYSSGLEFLRNVNPSYGVISLDANNKFNYPSFRALKNLKDAKIKALRTDELGDIIFTTNGQEIKIINK